MKKITLLLAALLLVGTYHMAQAKKKKGTIAYGKAFKVENVTAVENVAQLLVEPSGAMLSELDNVTVEGPLAQVCQAEGCWIKLKSKTGQDLLVKFKDHSFVIPTDTKASKVIAHGKLIRKVVSVEEQKHMLEDAGAKQEDIDKITTPKVEQRIEATGIIVYTL